MTTGSISTDDYHRGKAWLESTYGAPWTNWDAPEVYDTRLLNYDLWQFSQGLAIDARRFDFAQEESVIEGRIEPCELLLVEGIYAGSPDLEDRRHLHIAIPTPLATSIGRRLARDQQEGRLNASLADPKAILRYQLEVAEPMYQQQLAA
jgi:uridine kinase